MHVKNSFMSSDTREQNKNNINFDKYKLNFIG